MYAVHGIYSSVQFPRRIVRDSAVSTPVLLNRRLFFTYPGQKKDHISHLEEKRDLFLSVVHNTSRI
jgi:hypothetical protein